MKIDKERLEMLKDIMALDFSVLELNLYLDTHPMDRRALSLHNEYVIDLKNIKSVYEEKYSLITAESISDCPWEWIEEPWPWEIDYEMGGR